MINYKLAKEIGATHHIDHLLYKFNDDGFAMCYFTEYGWEKTENDAAHMAELERIDFNKQKPRTRTEYEKVTESIFDLRDEFERGELYCKNLAGNEDYQQLNTEVALFGCAAAGNVYLRVEKEIDWQDEVYAWQHTAKVGIYTPLDFTVEHLISAHPDKFLELCRVALRANWEVE